MKFVACLVVVFGTLVFADAPVELGNFKGLSFSGATLRHAMEFVGGRLVNCTEETGVEVTKCDAQGTSLTVSGGAENSLSITLTKVAILKSGGSTPAHAYYFHGTHSLKVGEKTVAAPVRVVVAIEDSTPDRARGNIEFTEQYAKSTFDAYKVKR